MTNSIEELAGADTIFVIGSNTTAAHPLVADRLYRAKKNGATIIVADPRKIQLALTADLYVSQALGSDAALINGIAHIIIKEGWQNQQFIDDNTEGYEEFKALVQGYTPERTTELTGVSAEDLYFIAEKYAKAPAGSIVYCMGITQHTSGVDNVKSLANLAMLTGQIGRESTGVNPLRGQNNVQGACDMGGLPDVYPGYQKVDVPEIQAKFAKAWDAELSLKPGLKIPDMLSGLNDGSVKALIVVGENPMMSDPDQHHVEQALKKAELLVTQDIFDHQTAQLAHVVLPGASYAEKDGTFSNTERRVQRPAQGGGSGGQLQGRLGDHPGDKQPLRLPHELRLPGRNHGGDSHGDPRSTGASVSSAWRARGCCGPAPPRTTPAPSFCTPEASSPGARACSTPSTGAPRPRWWTRSTPCGSPPGGPTCTITPAP